MFRDASGAGLSKHLRQRGPVLWCASQRNGETPDESTREQGAYENQPKPAPGIVGPDIPCHVVPPLNIPASSSEPFTDYSRWGLIADEGGSNSWACLRTDEECAKWPQKPLDN